MFFQALTTYLATPTFDHAIDAVPFILNGPGIARRWARSGHIDVEDPALDHLCRSLKRWTAFLGAGRRSHWQMRQRLARALPRALLALPRGRQWVNIGESDSSMSAAIARAAENISAHVKGLRSPVLGSKALHFLLPQLVPAYDNYYIHIRVMPAVTAGGRQFVNYVNACRVVIQSLSVAPRKRGIDLARRLVWRHLRRAYADTLATTDNMASRWCVAPPAILAVPALVDSYVAEYVLLGLWQMKNRARSRAIFGQACAAVLV